MHRDHHWDAESDEATDWEHRRRPGPSGVNGPSGDHGPSGGHAPSAGHGHGHSHDTEIPVSRQTTRIVGYILIPCAVITAIAMIFLWPGKPEQSTKHQATTTQRAYGSILRIDHQPCPADLPTYGEPLPCGQALVHVTDGPGKDQNVTMDLPQGPGAPRVSAGDQVVLGVSPDPTASGAPDRYEIIDEQRGKPMWLMLGLCAAAIVAFGRWRGLTALVGLVVSFAALLFFIIPAILGGEPPLLVAIVGSSAIMFAVLYLTHGVNVHTSVAVLGTLASLVVTGLLGAAIHRVHGTDRLR